MVAGLAALAALLVSLGIGLRARWLGETLELLDYPDTDGGRKRHAKVTPLVGGIALTLSGVAACLISQSLLPMGPWMSQHLSWLGAALLAMYLIGFADDRFALGPVIRLVLTIATLGIVLGYAPDFSLGFLRFAGQDSVWPLGVGGDAFALLCLVGLLNAVNMADGKNGIVLGMGLIWTVALAARVPAAFLPVLAAAGVSLGVLFAFNMRGRLFMGDGGSYALSALFGLLAVLAYNSDFATMRADDVAVLFAIPVFDTVRLMVMRKLSGRSPFEGDRDHLHHHLHAYFSWPRGLWLYLALVAVPNAGAVLLPGTGLIWLIVSGVAYAATLALTRLPALPRRAA